MEDIKNIGKSEFSVKFNKITRFPTGKFENTYMLQSGLE